MFPEKQKRFSPFHTLDIGNLKSYLYPWVFVEDYREIIKKVVLYRLATEMGVKYVIFFDVVCNKRNWITQRVHAELLKSGTPIMGNDFGCVYKGSVPRDFHDEWMLTDRKPYGLSRVGSLVLFSDYAILKEIRRFIREVKAFIKYATPKLKKAWKYCKPKLLRCGRFLINKCRGYAKHISSRATGDKRPGME